MSEWLNGFAYHIEMSVLTYLIAGALAVVITLITIGSQTLKAALINPATILKNE
jgi:putative ABC transport system permease protein